MKIRKIRKIENSNVYDIITHKHHNFFANGVLVHNCGEMPLPAWGNCNLGSMNLTKFVKYGFTKRAEFDYDYFKESIKSAVRFLDNINEIAIKYNLYSFKQQVEEVSQTRRVGLGIMGLGDMFVMLGIKFDSMEALETADSIFKTFRDTSYLASIDISKEKEPFKNWDYDKWVKSDFCKILPVEIKELAKKHGMRNLTTNSLAPSGTISIISGVSSGIEPIFKLEYDRKIRMGEDDKIIKVYHPIYQKFLEKNYDFDISLWRTAHDIKWQSRIELQGVIQKYIDTAISSTVNLDKETTVETIKDIYISAWKNKLKGITVYRDGSRSGILLTKKSRPETLESKTYQIKSNNVTYYVTISDIMEDGDLKKKPFEIFINSRDNNDLLSVITRLISAIMRRTDDPSFVITQLIKSANGEYGDFLNKLAEIIRKHMNGRYRKHLQEAKISYNENTTYLSECPGCKELSVVNENGCRTCKKCGWSACEI